ncbi:phosphatase PAP2 family protein [Sphingosinicella sp. BN140058]|uniref:phosphatase PAP2 family protein n=1 Tax=Sphingosinicella sp. BN140058 TaxID=1892855 RepID=UPI0013EAE978|nr:phosphatase PAP2 family protein [Sphingosinicella sp. BN140058]
MRISALDHRISEAMSAVAGHLPGLDWLLLQALQTDLLKLLPLVALLLLGRRDGEWRRETVTALLAATLALAACALAQHVGGDRVRPALSGLFAFPPLPPGAQADRLSFPSETIAAAFALAAVLARRGGASARFAYGWSLFAVAFPRLYGGYHYASDLVAGAAIGLLSARLLLGTGWKQLPAWRWNTGRGAAAGDVLLMLFAFEVGRLFADLRALADG